MPRNTKQVLYEALTTIPIDQSITAGLGTVTSVSMTTPSFLNVSGSPITTSGSLGLTLTTQTANTVFSGPTSGGAATPAFRALVAADIPSLSGTYQPLDATLTALAGLTIAAESLTIGTGADAFNQTTFAANTFPARASTGSLVAKTITDFGLSLVGDADASAARTTLGLGTMATQVASAVGISGGSIDDTVVTFGSGQLKILDTALNNVLNIDLNENLTANATLNLITGDSSRTLTFTADATIGGTHSGTSSGTNTGDQNIFQTIVVAGQSDVVADTTSDTLTLVAGTNITLTTNAGTDTITVAASGGGGTVTETELDFGSTPVTDKSFTVTDATVTAASKIMISPSGNVATGRVGNDYAWDVIQFSPVPASGSFTVNATVANGSVVGNRKVFYTVA